MALLYVVSALFYLCAMTSAASPPPGYNETYGYPDGIGGLIVEGPFPYKNGPPVWTNSTLSGAYGLLNAPGRYTNGECDAVPASSPFYKSDLKPVPLTDGLKDCLIGCNLTQVSETGHDPCHVGSVTYPTNSPMSCFDVGPGFAGGWGVCGYNCTAYHAKAKTLIPCTQADIGAGKCDIFCDTRTFP